MIIIKKNVTVQFTKGMLYTPKRGNIEFSNPNINRLKTVLENEKEDKKTAKSSRSKQSDFEELKKKNQIKLKKNQK